MLTHLSFPFVFFTVYFITNLQLINSGSSILLKELPFQNDTILKIGNYYEFFFYIDISSMKYNEEGILTFQFPKDIMHQNLVENISSRVEYIDEQLLNFFPITQNDSLFQYEIPFERSSNPVYESLIHLYFNKTINRTSNVHLLIDFSFKPEIDKYSQESFTISSVSLIENSTFNPFYGKIDFYRSIKPFMPIYVSFDLTNKYIYENIFIYCQEDVMTVYYDHIVKDNKINTNALSTNIASSDQYYMTTEENIQHKKLILKFMTDTEMVSFCFSIGYMNNPLILWKPVLTIQGFPIEITEQSQKVFMVGLMSQNHDLYFHVEHIYGKYSVHYSSTFFPYYLMNNSPNLLKSEQAFKKITDVIKIESDVNFIQIDCESPCRLNIILFRQIRMNTLYYSDIYYCILNQHNTEKIRVTNIDEFAIQIEILNKDDELTISYQDRTLKLDNNNNKMNDRIQMFNQNTGFLFEFKAGNGAFFRIILHRDYAYSVVPFGKSEYFLENIVFKLEKNKDIDCYVIEIDLKQKDRISDFYEYYGIGDDQTIPFPYFRTLRIYEKKIITLDNPYNKINQKIKLTDNQFYFYELKPFENRKTYTVNFTQIKKKITPILKLNTPILIDINSNSNIKRSLIQNLSSDYHLMLQFYKCSNSNFEYQLFYNQKLLKQNKIKRKRDTFISGNYYIDYSINFFSDDSNQSSFIFSYSYCETELLEDLLEVKNQTISYIKESSSSIRLQWKTYLNNVKGQVYMIYINEFDNNDHNCSFILNQPYVTLVYKQEIKDTLLNYTIKDIKKGVYKINIIAQENNKFNFTQIYTEVIVTLGIGNAMRNNIFIIISILLGMSSIYLYCFSKALKNHLSYSTKSNLISMF